MSDDNRDEFGAPASIVGADAGMDLDDDDMSIEEIERQLAEYEALAAERDAMEAEPVAQPMRIETAQVPAQPRRQSDVPPPIYNKEDLIKFLNGNTKAASEALSYGTQAVRAGASIPINVSVQKALSRGPEAGVDLSKTAGRQR